MPDRLDVAVIGAGPFGLSVAAHLNDRPVRVFGAPMQTWRTRMPPDMRLRSDWDETSLSAPGDRGSIDVWSRAQDEPREEPIPLTRRSCATRTGSAARSCPRPTRPTSRSSNGRPASSG